MCISVFTVCMLEHHLMLGIIKDQKRASDPLELELHMAVNHHIGVGN